MAGSPKPYAQETKVDPLRTHMEIQSLLKKMGATKFMTFNDETREGLMFVRDGISYRIVVAIPESEEEAKTWSRGGRKGSHETYVDMERARRMRSLLLFVKAKMVAVTDGIQSFEQAFVGDAVTDNDQTVSERMVPRVRQAALEGKYPSSLPIPEA